MYHSDNISILIYRGYWRFLCINILNFPQMFFKIHVNCFIKIGENDICWFELFVSFIWLIRIQSIHLVTVSLLLIKDLQHIENLSWYIITLSSPYILWNKSLCTQILLGSKWSVCDLLYVHLSVCLSVCILRTVLCHLCDSNPSTLIVARRSALMGAGILMFVVWNTIYCAFYNLISCSMLIWLWYIYE